MRIVARRVCAGQLIVFETSRHKATCARFHRGVRAFCTKRHWYSTHQKVLGVMRTWTNPIWKILSPLATRLVDV